MKFNDFSCDALKTLAYIYIYVCVYFRRALTSILEIQTADIQIQAQLRQSAVKKNFRR